MSRYISLILVILLLLPPVSKVVYVVDYSLNKEYIISMYCINRDKPELTCEGKCHLTKQLTKAGQAEKAHILKEKIEILYFIGAVLCVLASPEKILTEIIALYYASYVFQVAVNIFHPPRMMCNAYLYS